jgi:hypothetical protein
MTPSNNDSSSIGSPERYDELKGWLESNGAGIGAEPRNGGQINGWAPKYVCDDIGCAENMYQGKPAYIIADISRRGETETIMCNNTKNEEQCAKLLTEGKKDVVGIAKEDSYGKPARKYTFTDKVTKVQGADGKMITRPVIGIKTRVVGNVHNPKELKGEIGVNK